MPAGGRVRVLVADDDAMFRLAVQEVVNGEPDLEVAGVARDGAEAWHMTLELNPDVVVLDVDMPIVGGFEVLTRLRHESPQVRIVMHTSDPMTCDIARRLGAVDCVAKDAPPDVLLAAIRRAAGAK